MRYATARLFAWALLPALYAAANAQQPREIVQQAVRTDLAAYSADNTNWLFFETDQKPGNTVVQWVAQTSHGQLSRVLQYNGRQLTLAQQISAMDAFIRNTSAQADQRKTIQHDVKQLTDVLNLLPDAFLWTITEQHDGVTLLHFTPNPAFQPPTRELRVFAAMHGDIAIDDAQHRIVSLTGTMIRDVSFAWGILGKIESGGTFEVKRSQVAPGNWQITETRIHIEGRMYFFKSVSQQQDDESSGFIQLPVDITFEQAKARLLAMP